MSDANAALRKFLAFVELHGSTTILLDELERILGGGVAASAAIGALADARILREASLATFLPCGGSAQGCEREVREIPVDVAHPTMDVRYITTCGATPRDCETVDVPRSALRRVTISIADLARTIRTLLEIDTPTSFTGRGDPIEIGEQHKNGYVRDVIFARRVDESGLDRMLEMRQKLSRRSLILVATANIATAERRARHAPGAHVELDVLTDMLVIKNGRIALAPRVRLVRPEPRITLVESELVAVDDGDDEDRLDEDEEEADSKPEKRELPAIRKMIPAITSWRALTLILVNGETVAVKVGRHKQRATYRDLGMHWKKTLKPRNEWHLLCEILRTGEFPKERFGKSIETAKMPAWRLGKAMSRAFGLEESPFQKFNQKTWWKPKFWGKEEEE